MLKIAKKRIQEALETKATSLDLSTLGLEKMPASITELTHLKELNLSHNRIFYFPEEVLSLTQLETLNLSWNHTCEIPNDISKLSHLRELDLFDTRLSKLSPGICKLSQLETLNLGYNHIEELPAEIKNLTNLTHLNLKGNKYIKLCTELGELPKLTSLELLDCGIKEFPTQITNLTSLTTLYIGSNQIRELPAEIRKMSTLKKFSLHDNLLEELPPEIGELQSLDYLGLNTNRLSTLPPELGKLSNLRAIEIAWNQQKILLPEELLELNVNIFYDGVVEKSGRATFSGHDVFSFEGLSGQEAPDLFLETLQKLEWSEFNANRHGYDLRSILQSHEKSYGPGDAFAFVSEQIRSKLTLPHPFSHEGKIQSHGLSPDGKWFATGSWMGEDYDHGGVVHIWEVATGQIVNDFRISGGVGWSNRNGMEWSPDSKYLAMSYYTNHVGVWNPFDDGDRPKIFASVTGGRNEPPEFTWSLNGEKIYINCPLYGETQAKGCWIDFLGDDGNVLGSAVSGDPETKPEPAKTEEAVPKRLGISVGAKEKFYLGEKKAILISESNLKFYDAQDGSLLNEFQYLNPGEPHDLVLDHTDPYKTARMHPAFGLNLEGQEEWGYAFPEGVLVVPENYPAHQYFNFSLGNKLAWPLEWVKHIRVTSLAELSRLDTDLLPKDLVKNLEEIGGQNQTKANHTAGGRPPAMNKTYEDIYQLTLDSLQAEDQSGFSLGDYYMNVAIGEIKRGNYEGARGLSDKSSPYRKSQYLAELASHLLKSGEDAADLVEAAEESFSLVNDVIIDCRATSWLSIALYLSGQKEKAKEYETMALKICSQGSFRRNWEIFNMYIMTNQLEQAITLYNEQGFGSYSNLPPGPYYNFIWYRPIDDYITFIKACRTDDNGSGKPYDILEFTRMKIIQDKSYEQLVEVTELMDVKYAFSDVLIPVLRVMPAEHPNIPEIIERCLKLKEYNDWLSLLELAAERYPELVAPYLKDKMEQNIAGAQKNDDEYGAIDLFNEFFQLGKIIALLAIENDYQSAREKLGDVYLPAYICGLASGKESAEATSLLEQAISKQKECKNKLQMQLWHMVVKMAFLSKAEKYAEYVDIARDNALKIYSEWELNHFLVDFMLSYGDFENAHAAWMRIPEGSKAGYVLPLLEYLCSKNDYDSLHKVILNVRQIIFDRSKTAVNALSILNHSKPYETDHEADYEDYDDDD